MTENWVAVSKAINERVAELGWKQRELAERSGVSQAIVREIQHHTVERRRSARTLEALSLALGWHPGHLAAVLRGRKPLAPGETGDEVIDEITARLSGIEDRLGDITDRLDVITANLATLLRASGHREIR
ncbi:helix-turn-helix transcriptional regulator [Amycolatopsis cynarae]|uniref:Helix-turn-helix transcriptional regulator n=1 Tax=Amycolatopsis cynarae TaxID=2995223 RepID=A0ABY7AYS7_9PSEU|nr:helix-turn-helix transcriptional regulator [Amycolatopsis sp. HUAS 11-8]WAL63758.1 helix-turn-helix transcriptional regulator [Amycolatopsis sp. HUAS 11-8]